MDAMLSRVAEVCMEAVEEARRRMLTAEDDAGFERSVRTLNSACRNVRQTIGLKQRFDREQAALAAGRVREAAAADALARSDRDAAARIHRELVSDHFERILWDEYEDAEAHEIYSDLNEHLRDIARDDDFLETPVATLIQRMAEEFGIGAARKRDDDDNQDKDDAPSAPPSPLRGGAGGGGETPEPAGPPPSAETAGPDLSPPEPSPPPPPDPPPYIPPWEFLRPGQRITGGTGW